ncbi:cohesin domain-containing protein [Andreprevotia chitinilytica]|uniref:cohesin domain-containing protein n=1 Tax=Andreprevotia chitinilytica TaxID=396808 RepID=UPI00068F143D|nr:cohesin domain-containing protein [Andreprevotia chitinilytica]
MSYLLGWPRLKKCLLLAAALSILTGCAGQQAYENANKLFDAGKNQEGFELLKQAAKEAPGNVEYRMALVTKRATIIENDLKGADAARRRGDLQTAENLYREIQLIEPRNDMAAQGLDAVAMEKRHRALLADVEAILNKRDPAQQQEAREKLRIVLSENPGQKEALALKARADATVEKSITPELQLAAAYSKPITLEFRDAPFKSVFEVISKVSGLNFFFDKEIRPDLKVTVLAKNTSIEDAVRLMLATNQLEQKILSENAILIYPSTPQKIKDYQTLSVRSFFVGNADIKSVANTLKTILKTKDMVIDERLNIIIMRDTPDVLRMAERIISLQDLPDPEVMLEVEVLEIQRAKTMQLGITWPDQVALAPVASNGTTLTVSDLAHLHVGTMSVKVDPVTLNAHKDDQDANLLANPRIRVRNKEKAKIMIGDRVPVVTTTSTATGFVSESVTYADVGLKLEVEPNVYLDSDVAIKINLEVSTIAKEVQTKSGSLVYQIGTRNATTVLRLRDGETQVLAGLINDQEHSSGVRIPGLGDFPVLGRLFGSQKDDHSRSEIVLAITPRVIRGVRRPDLDAAEFESGTETSLGAKPLLLKTITPDKKIKTRETDDAANAGAKNAVPTTKEPAATAAKESAAKAGDAPKAAAASAPAVNDNPPALSWNGPAQVKEGEPFTLDIKLDSGRQVQGMPMLLSFDPNVLQVVAVREGDYLKQQGGVTTFNQRLDPQQGKIFVSGARRSAKGQAEGVAGSGTVVSVVFKPVTASADSSVELISASFEPDDTGNTPMPAGFSFRVGS